MRFTFIINEKNEAYLKSIKGHGESLSSVINRSIEKAQDQEKIIEKLNLILSKLQDSEE